MSQKLDIDGNIVGPYGIDELRTFWFPEEKTKGHRREHLRDLDYDLIWDVTEMQVKVYVQAIFPNQLGSPLFQLAKEQALAPDEKTITGESRSKALDDDIKIAQGQDEDVNENDDDASEDQRRAVLSDNHTLVGSQPSTGPARGGEQRAGAESSTSNIGAYQQTSQGERPLTTSQNRQHQTQVQQQAHTQQQSPAQHRRTIPTDPPQQIQNQQVSASSGVLRPTVTSQRLPPNTPQSPATAPSSSSNTRTDGRRRDGKVPPQPHFKPQNLLTHPRLLHLQIPQEEVRLCLYLR